MENLDQFNLKELSKKELQESNGGHWAINLAAATVAIFYNFGKDSYHIHPQSFV